MRAHQDRVVKPTLSGDVIAKDRRKSPRKIDAAVEAMIALDRTVWHAEPDAPAASSTRSEMTGEPSIPVGEIDDKWLYRTSGPGCHWCAIGETIHVWGPYGTNVCAECADLITEGRKWQVAETVAARITVRDNWHDVSPEREHALIDRWLALRTDCTAVPPGKPHCESQLWIDAENRYVVGCDRVNVHDGPHRA